MRRKGISTVTQSQARMRAVEVYRLVNALWEGLSDSQLAAWSVAGRTEEVWKKISTRSMTGIELFRAVNLTLYHGVGLTQSDPPSSKPDNRVTGLDSLEYQSAFSRLVTWVNISNTAERDIYLQFKFSAPASHSGVPYNIRRQVPARPIDQGYTMAKNIQANPSGNAWVPTVYDYSGGGWVWVDLMTWSLDMYPLNRFRWLTEVEVT